MANWDEHIDLCCFYQLCISLVSNLKIIVKLKLMCAKHFTFTDKLKN